MNFSMHRGIYLKNKKTIKIFLLINILFFISVILFEIKTLTSRLIVVGCLIAGLALTRFFWNKAMRAQKIRLNEVEALYGNETIVCYAENYSGLVRKDKYGYLVLMTIYVALILYVCVMLYTAWISSVLVLTILSIVHISLAIPIMVILIKMLDTAVFFTKDTLFLSHSNEIELEKIKKYQFIECVKGGAVLELNTGDHFVRLSLADKEHHIIEKLINHTQLTKQIEL